MSIEKKQQFTSATEKLARMLGCPNAHELAFREENGVVTVILRMRYTHSKLVSFNGKSVTMRDLTKGAGWLEKKPLEDYCAAVA